MENKTLISWYDLRNRQYVYLKEGVLKKLIKKGVIKSGSLSKFCIALGTTHFYTKLKDNCGISIGKLKQVLDYLNIRYNFIDNKISEIRRGNIYSIKDPKFPIDLLNERMGSILGHIVSDGSLNYDKTRKNYIRTRYYSPDKQLIDIFSNNIKEVFGKIHFNRVLIRSCNGLSTGCSVVGETLRFAGAGIGKKYKLNNKIPWLIKCGDNKIQKNYLSAVFDDEGSVGELNKPYIILSRNIHVKLANREMALIKKHVGPYMKRRIFPTGHIDYRIPIRKFISLIKELDYTLCKKILNAKPKLLLDESKLLRSFDIENFVYVMSFNITNNGNYSVSSTLVIRRKIDVINFYRNIGFKLDRKQDKLKNALINSGWLNYGS